MMCDHDDDWVGFTFGDAVESLRCKPPCAHAFKLVANMACAVVRKQKDLASQGYVLYDWHKGNIAFHDTAATQVFLVDWQHNLPSDGPVFKRNMTKAFQKFTKYLHDPAYDSAGSAWAMFMQKLQGALNSWFSALHWLPTNQDPRPRPNPIRPKLETSKSVSNKKHKLFG